MSRVGWRYQQGPDHMAEALGAMNILAPRRPLHPPPLRGLKVSKAHTMQVRGLHILLLYLSLAVAANDLPAPASITAAPELEIRQVANSICGYYSLNGLCMISNTSQIGSKAKIPTVSTISCSVNTPCLVGNTLDPTAVGYCSGTNNAPITSIFAFGNYPPGGCTGGQVCW